MIQTIILGAWSCVIAVATMAFGLSSTASKTELTKDSSTAKMTTEFSTPTVLIAPIVLNTKVVGYLFSNVLVEFSPKAMKSTNASIDLILRDAYNSFLIGNIKYAFPKQERLNFVEFKEDFQNTINKTIGNDLVLSIQISDLNYLTSGEVRSKQDLKSVWWQEQQSRSEPVSKVDITSDH